MFACLQVLFLESIRIRGSKIWDPDTHDSILFRICIARKYWYFYLAFIDGSGNSKAARILAAVGGGAGAAELAEPPASSGPSMERNGGGNGGRNGGANGKVWNPATYPLEQPDEAAVVAQRQPYIPPPVLGTVVAQRQPYIPPPVLGTVVALCQPYIPPPVLGTVSIRKHLNCFSLI